MLRFASPLLLTLTLYFSNAHIGTIAGTVSDDSGAVVNNAGITVANPNPNDLTVRNINISKQGTDIYPYNYGPGYSRHIILGVQR